MFVILLIKLKQVITFHSYKGGTGKTTLATNLAALLAKKGNNVCIVDIDVYAPSLHSYFGDKVQNKINHKIILLENVNMF